MAETGGYTLTVLLLPKCSGHWEAAAQPGTTAAQQTGTEMMCVTSEPAFLKQVCLLYSLSQSGGRGLKALGDGSSKRTEGASDHASTTWTKLLAVRQHPHWAVTVIPPLLCSFTFYGFSYPQSTTVQKYYMKNTRDKQFVSFRLCTNLSSVAKSLLVPLHPT